VAQYEIVVIGEEPRPGDAPWVISYDRPFRVGEPLAENLDLVLRRVEASPIEGVFQRLVCERLPDSLPN
jgi:hypothetical protein